MEYFTHAPATPVAGTISTGTTTTRVVVDQSGCCRIHNKYSSTVLSILFIVFFTEASIISFLNKIHICCIAIINTVAGAHLRGVCAQVQRVRRAGAPDWLYHRAGDGATDTGACRQADNCTSNRTRALTTGGGECTAADCSRSNRGSPRA